MRVLVAGAHWELIGGSERHTQDVSQALARAGHEVSVMADEPAEEQRGEPTAITTRRESGRPTLVSVPGCAAATPLGPAARRALSALLDEFRPQVILALVARNAEVLSTLMDAAPLVRFVQDHVPFCPGGNKTLQGGRPCVQPAGVRCLFTALLGAGCAGLRGPRGPALARTFAQWRRSARGLACLRRTAHLLVASEYMASELRAVGCRRERITLLPYFTNAATPLNSAADGPVSQDSRAAPDPPLILTPARLTLPDKGVDYLLTALAKLRSPFRALICGDGPARAWLEQKARDEGLAERVQFAGWCSSQELERHYAQAAIVAVPSMWNEPFGIVGIEAMAHGLPVVAFDVGGIPAWLHPGKTGSLVPRGDTVAFAAALDELLADGDLRRRYGAAGQKRVTAEHRPARHLESLVALLAQAATGQVPGTGPAGDAG
ncbi:MAG TPA: glycosyltransferase family 4 protein [Planctomycetota bacterium]|nr:glycosyltransferase family 4 protein [Planctomycetota bacterium]